MAAFLFCAPSVCARFVENAAYGSCSGRLNTIAGRMSFPKEIRMTASAMMSVASTTERVSIMVNDCFGKMGRATAEEAVEAGLQLVPMTFSGPQCTGKKGIVSGIEVESYPASAREIVMDTILALYPNLVIVDYTVPTAVNENAEFYCRQHVPFVMGTTGGDRERLMKTVCSSNNYAVISPQMGKQIREALLLVRGIGWGPQILQCLAWINQRCWDHNHSI